MQQLVRHLKGSRVTDLAARSFRVPQLRVCSPNCAHQPRHIQTVQQRLHDQGMLKLSLGFPDDDSEYLRNLIVGLSKLHGHGLPIDHSASQGWFWDIRPSVTCFQSNSYQARSETMQDFPWHTDCSYEDNPPRYFALQVVQPDQLGGGTFSTLNVQRVVDLLSPAAKTVLRRPEYRITVPPEFVRSSTQSHITASLLAADEFGAPAMIRFRGDIITPLTVEAKAALNELGRALLSPDVQEETLHLTAENMPRGSVLLMDNRRWLHARNEVKDPERHLRRVRWDAIPFASTAS